ncbi:MAG: amidase [Azospirillaceae bacterium]|nr:amidase [Azospirillaceae bacterium]
MNRDRVLSSTADDPWSLPVSVLAEEIASGRVTSVEVVDAFLARITEHDDKLHAYVEVYQAEARLAADAADKAIQAGHAVGPFHGVPIALKDLIELKGRITTAGSVHFRNRRTAVTATVAQRLMAQGLIVLGKTHTVELAYTGWGINEGMGTPWNPWDRATHRIPGGSSSGSGVAVAAGLAPWAIGTDTGGSVRLPAAFCGLTGLKPTVGRISTAGIIPLSATLDTPGPVARSVLDAALLYNLMRDPGHAGGTGPASDPLPTLKRGVRGLRLGRMPQVERDGVDAAVLEAYDRSLRTLAELGAEIVDVALPFRFDDCFPVHLTVVHAEAYAHFREMIEDDATLLSSSVRIGISLGRDISAQQYLCAQKQRGAMAAAMADALGEVDALLTPTTESPAVPVDRVDTSRSPSRFTRFVNTLDMCALALPNGATSGGLPLSLQIVCKGHDEAIAFRIGYEFQTATTWHLRTPQL